MTKKIKKSREVVALYRRQKDDGSRYKKAEIARIMGVSKQYVGRIIKEWEAVNPPSKNAAFDAQGVPQNDQIGAKKEAILPEDEQLITLDEAESRPNFDPSLEELEELPLDIDNIAAQVWVKLQPRIEHLEESITDAALELAASQLSERIDKVVNHYADAALRRLIREEAASILGHSEE